MIIMMGFRQISFFYQMNNPLIPFVEWKGLVGGIKQQQPYQFGPNSEEEFISSEFDTAWIYAC